MDNGFIRVDLPIEGSRCTIEHIMGLDLIFLFITATAD